MQMTLSERMIRYRALHDLTQKQLGSLMGESAGVIYRFENSKLKHHKKNVLRIESKMDELERGDCSDRNVHC